MSEQKPSIGRIVHYRQGSGDRAIVEMEGPSSDHVHPAIVTKVNEDNTLNLHVFVDGGPSISRSGVRHVDCNSDNDKPESSGWCWPPRA